MTQSQKKQNVIRCLVTVHCQVLKKEKHSEQARELELVGVKSEATKLAGVKGGATMIANA